MEFLPILQDFVYAMFCNFTTSKRQGKGTADLMMPFGVLLLLYSVQIAGKLMGKKFCLEFFDYATFWGDEEGCG